MRKMKRSLPRLAVRKSRAHLSLSAIHRLRTLPLAGRRYSLSRICISFYFYFHFIWVLFSSSTPFLYLLYSTVLWLWRNHVSTLCAGLSTLCFPRFQKRWFHCSNTDIRSFWAELCTLSANICIADPPLLDATMQLHCQNRNIIQGGLWLPKCKNVWWICRCLLWQKLLRRAEPRYPSGDFGRAAMHPTNLWKNRSWSYWRILPKHSKLRRLPGPAFPGLFSNLLNSCSRASDLFEQRVLYLSTIEYTYTTIL